MTKLSIIIANYNTYDLTRDCINSIFSFKPNFDFEIIVVDDASTDGSYKKLKKLEADYENLKVILSDKNGGYVTANNKGLAISKGDYKLLLNSDTKVTKYALSNLIEFAQSASDAGVVGSQLLNTDGTVQPSCFHFPTLKNTILSSILGKTKLTDKYAPTGSEPIAVDAVVGASFLITPKAYKQVGMLNIKYKSYFEDLDYCRSLWQNSLKVYYLPKSQVIHYHGETFKKLAGFENQWRELIPSSIVYHGLIKHCLIFLIMWLGQKKARFFS
jgi:GT2 family glycosyltransferase